MVISPDLINEIQGLPPRRLEMLRNLIKASRYCASLTRRYNVVLQWNPPEEDDPEGGYTVLVPSLPPVVTEGRDREEALANVREAIGCYLEYLLLTGAPLPDSDTAGDNLVQVTV